MEKVKAILIDSTKETVEEIMIIPNLKGMYAAIGCRMVEKVDLFNNDLWVDEEGMYNSETYFHFHTQPFAGNGLFLCSDNEGGSIGTTLTKEFVESRIKFISL